VLVPLSSANLEELSNPTAIEDYIIDNAAAIWAYANSKRRLTDSQSLYFVTGAIKGNSWAIASFREEMKFPFNKLKLHLHDPSSALGYVWLERGVAEAKVGPHSSSYRNAKNQCLFLRGYKLSASMEVRSQLRAARHTPCMDGHSRHSPSSDSQGLEPRDDDPNRRGGHPSSASNFDQDGASLDPSGSQSSMGRSNPTSGASNTALYAEEFPHRSEVGELADSWLHLAYHYLLSFVIRVSS